MNYVDEIKKNLDDESLSGLFDQIKSFSNEINIFFDLEGEVDCFNDLDYQIIDYFKLTFNRDIDNFDEIIDMNFFDICNLDLQIINIGFNNNNNNLLLCLLLLLKDLEELSEKDIENSAYYFLFENK